jgi:hypothetical protein
MHEGGNPNSPLNFYCFVLFTHIALNWLLSQVYCAHIAGPFSLTPQVSPTWISWRLGLHSLFCTIDLIVHTNYTLKQCPREIPLSTVAPAHLARRSNSPQSNSYCLLHPRRTTRSSSVKVGWNCWSFFKITSQFPTLWVIVQQLFLNLAGYISSPWHTRLEVRTYERLAMLASIMGVVYIDPEWVHQKQHHVPYNLAILINGTFLLIHRNANMLWAFQYLF